MPTPLKIELDREGGRWIAEVLDLPGVLVYGDTQEEAILQAKILALRVIADRMEHGEAVPDSLEFSVLGEAPTDPRVSGRSA
ncbi:Predicted nuclease of the RNAse H fold, HicB family [Stigmatella erecta]|uniref:Predicted nuclease of the RNAse H fold, HicB family n=1 Tax=Stigmatella erecta TaxID=83460 RepID=A0A1I0KFB6_9BACT|nr:Predicted nuclease of the RNAse H fold, HicB family [Stigmatella erecta]